MNLIEAIDLADTLYTVGMLALTVGCPVAGATFVVSKIILKQAAKAYIKHLTVSATAGVVAVACAAMQSGENNGDGSAPFVSPPGIPTAMLEVEEMHFIISENPSGDSIAASADGQTTYPVGSLFKELLPLIVAGKLKHVSYEFEFPDDRYGEVVLEMMNIGNSLENIQPHFEFQQSKKAEESNDEQ